MAGLKGLDASSVAARQHAVDDKALQEFIGGAPLQAQSDSAAPTEKASKKKTPTAKFVRTNFSLSDKTNKQIDQLALAPRTFRVSRSDVIRAGVAALKAMPRSELIKLLASTVGADDNEESTETE